MTAKPPSIIVAPSILSADLGNLEEEVAGVRRGGADWIHVDVMDGHFVPPITFGPPVVEALRSSKKLASLGPLFLDVHLMIEQPERQIGELAKAGADLVTVHQEACPHLHRVVQNIHEEGMKAGVAINPATPATSLEGIVESVDLILVMTVNPGWGGQAFIESTLKKIHDISEMVRCSGRDVFLEVDGGINAETAPRAIAQGADVLVAGSFIFGSADPKVGIEALRSAARTR